MASSTKKNAIKLIQPRRPYRLGTTENANKKKVNDCEIVSRHLKQINSALQLVAERIIHKSMAAHSPPPCELRRDGLKPRRGEAVRRWQGERLPPNPPHGTHTAWPRRLLPPGASGDRHTVTKTRRSLNTAPRISPRINSELIGRHLRRKRSKRSWHADDKYYNFCHFVSIFIKLVTQKEELYKQKPLKWFWARRREKKGDSESSVAKKV